MLAIQIKIAGIDLVIGPNSVLLPIGRLIHKEIPLELDLLATPRKGNVIWVDSQDHQHLQ